MNMKKTLLFAFTALFAFGQGLWAQNYTPHFTGTLDAGKAEEGDGSKDKPYRIKSVEDLNV